MSSLDQERGTEMEIHSKSSSGVHCSRLLLTSWSHSWSQLTINTTMYWPQQTFVMVISKKVYFQSPLSCPSAPHDPLNWFAWSFTFWHIHANFSDLDLWEFEENKLILSYFECESTDHLLFLFCFKFWSTSCRTAFCFSCMCPTHHWWREPTSFNNYTRNQRDTSLPKPLIAPT